MNKKIIPISALTVVLSLPSFAQIANNATCNDTNLGTSANGSTANIDANWSQNQININWYNGNTKVSESHCMYDDTIVLPTEPTKPGYTFAGWRLRSTLLCKEITDQTECTSNGCSWNKWSGCFFPCYNSFTNEADCNANAECAYQYSCYGENDHCTNFDGGTRCDTMMTQEDCEDKEFNVSDMCVWENGKCIYHINLGACPG